MGDAAVTFLLENMVTLLSDNVHLMMNAKSELDELEKELQEMKAFLQDASKMQNKEENFKESMRQMREIVYDVEDTIDSYISNPKSFSLANKVKDLREKAKSVLDIAREKLSVHGNKSLSSNTSAQETRSLRPKYLTLSGDEFKILPEAISKLSNMQTLTVNTLSRTLDVKENIWDMLQLRHVKTNASIILKKGGKGKGGENLQTLCRLSPDSCTDDVFNKAKNIKTLSIRGDLTTILGSNYLGKLEHLQKLKLMYHVYHKVASENPLQNLPQRLPPKIKVLTLSTTYLNWTHMYTLQKLSTLQLLKLKDNAFVGKSWEATGSGFHQLQILYIERTDLNVWTASGDSFPKLRSLVLKNCENLQGVPIELATSLEMLSMERVTTYAVSSAIKIKEKNKDLAKEQAERGLRAKMGEFKLIIASGDAPVLNHKY